MKLNKIENKEKKIVKIPICINSEFSLDLNRLSEKLKTEKEKIIKSFLNKEYFCYMTGFIAGMPFLGDIDSNIRLSRLETPRVPDGSFTQLLIDSFDAYTNKKDLQVHKIDYWTMRNNIEKWFYENKFYDNWKPTFFVEDDLQKIRKDSGESYLYFKNKFIHQFKDDINKIYEKTNINRVINEIKQEL